MGRYRPRLLAALGAAALFAALTAPAASGQQIPAIPATPGGVPAALAEFGGYAAADALHAHALENKQTPLNPGSRLANVDVSPSAAVVDSKGLRVPVQTEYGRQVTAARPDARSFGFADALEVGLGTSVPVVDPGLQLPGQVTKYAPEANINPVVDQTLELPLAPLAYVQLLRAEAFSAWDINDPCVLLGADLAYGSAKVTDVELLETGQRNPESPPVAPPRLQAPLVATDVAPGGRAVVWTVSRSFFDKQADQLGRVLGDKLGITSEARATIAPVTFFRGTNQQFTVELLGEWVLRSRAGGIPGSASIHYGPSNQSPEVPVLRVIRPGQTDNVITAGQLANNPDGTTVTVPGLATIVLGEAPRAIGVEPESPPFQRTPAQVDPAGLSSSGATDVLRVKLLETPTSMAAEVRLGHLETASTAPAGGISCPLPVSKRPSVDNVVVGDTFNYVITVRNPFSCTLTNLQAVDLISAAPGSTNLTWEVLPTTPDAVREGVNRVVFTLPLIEPGQSATLTIPIRVLTGSPGDVFTDSVTVAGLCVSISPSGEDLTAPVAGRADVIGPAVVAQRAPNTIPRVEPPAVAPVVAGPQVAGGAAQRTPTPATQLPRTGASALVSLLGIVLAGSALFLRRRMTVRR